MMHVSVIAGSHLGDFFNILPVVSGLQKIAGEPVHFTIPRAFNEKFPTLREFLEYQPMFASVAFDNERPFQGIQIHAFKRQPFKPYPMPRPTETYRAQYNVETDYGIPVAVDDQFEFVVPDLQLDFDQTKNLVGERSHHSRRNQRKEYFLKPSGHFNDCLFLDFNDSMMVNAWKIKQCQGVFISTFTGISIMADLMNKRHVVAWDQESVDDCVGYTVDMMFERHYYGDRQGQLLHLDTFSWDQVK